MCEAGAEGGEDGDGQTLSHWAISSLEKAGCADFRFRSIIGGPLLWFVIHPGGSLCRLGQRIMSMTDAMSWPWLVAQMTWLLEGRILLGAIRRILS